MGSLGPATANSLMSTAVGSGGGGSHGKQQQQTKKLQQQEEEKSWVFRMPLHYPRYSKADYEAMPEWKLDRLLKDYGLPLIGGLDDKREFAMGAFLWPSHQ